MRRQWSRTAAVLALPALVLGFTIGAAQAAALASTPIAESQVIVIGGPDIKDTGPKVVVISDPGPPPRPRPSRTPKK